MENWPPNPYFNLTAIRNSNMFFGRANLLRRFYAAIANRQCVSLIGPRSIGKSSLLRCACLAEMQVRFDFDLSRHIFVPLDLREYLFQTSEDFFHGVSKEIVSQSSRLADLTLPSKGRGDEVFSYVLDQIEEQMVFPVLLLDSFDNITLNKSFGPEFFSFLRAHATAGRITYVTASIAPLYEVSHRGIAGSPFFNIFYTYPLEAFTHDEALELISIPADRAGMSFTNTEITWVLNWAGRHPFFIQRVCHVLFEEKMQAGNSSTDEKRFEQRVKNLAYKELLPYFVDTWERLSEAQRSSLLDEAQQKGNPLRELPELSDSAFFRQFVRNTSQIGLFHMSVDELEDALKKLNDPKALGETNLRLMKAVAQRLRRDTALSSVERGMAIREVLNEAFECLHGPGTRTDTAPEWRFYNILFYRYFRHHLKNALVAMRLEFTSDRQFFRERNKAIESLRTNLIEMETRCSSDE